MNSACKKKGLTLKLDEARISEIEAEAEKLAEFLYSLYREHKQDNTAEEG
jgi:hypothetical protein